MEIADAYRIAYTGVQSLCAVIGEPDLLFSQALSVVLIDSGHERIGNGAVGSIEAIRQVGEEPVSRAISRTECLDDLLLQEDAGGGDLYLAVDALGLQAGEGRLPRFRYLRFVQQPVAHE